MATMSRNPSRPLGQSTIPKSRTKKTTSRPPPPSTITSNTKEMQKRFGNNSSRDSMYPPSSILKKRPFPRRSSDPLDQNAFNRNQPSDLEPMKSKPFYSPIHTPPRLRTLITPPGIEPYRNHHNIRGLYSPLPGLDDWHSLPIGLSTWGLDPTDYHLNSNLNLIRRYPSPLSLYGLSSALPRQKKEPSDYVYVRQNEAFANHYIEDFISKSIEDQLIPDILLEIIGELEEESKARGGKSYKTEVNRYYTELNRRIHQKETIDTQLFSDDWMRELEHQRTSAPVSNVDSYTSSLKPLDFHELVPAQTTSRVRYHDLPPDVQGRLLADINQELIDFEVRNMVTDLSDQTLTNRTPIVPVVTDNIHDNRNSQRQRIDQTQYDSVEKYAQNKLFDTMCLDQLFLKYIRQTGSIVDVDDLSRLLDDNILRNLIHQYQSIDENRSETLDNYGARKFHLNSFMNTTLDFLLTELSGSLIEDMKDVDEEERRTFS